VFTKIKILLVVLCGVIDNVNAVALQDIELVVVGVVVVIDTT
jgi:hypothetical protein